jgi:hypothetical protein
MNRRESEVLCIVSVKETKVEGSMDELRSRVAVGAA